MAAKRIQIANSKRSAHSKHGKREIAKLMEEGKVEKAIIKVEHIIRDDFTMEAYEIIELMCELVHERAKHLSNHPECPVDLMEAVTTVLWASTRVDISELEGARKQLVKKYGKEFFEMANNNEGHTVNSRVVHKLNIAPPEPLLIRKYLKEIAAEYNVGWDEESFPIDEKGRYKNGQQMGFSVAMGPASGLGHLYANMDGEEEERVAPPPTYDDSRAHLSVTPGSIAPVRYEEQHQQAPGAVSMPPALPTQQQQQQQYSSKDNPPQYTPSQQYQPGWSPAPGQVEPSVISPSSAGGGAAGGKYHEEEEEMPHPPPPPPSAAGNSSATGGGAAPSFDDLAARFANLKR